MKRFSLALIILACSLSSFAKEGMWIPSLIKNLVESDMQSMGHETFGPKTCIVLINQV